MTRTVATAVTILAAAAAAAADDVTIRSMSYKDVTVVEVKDGEIHFRASRRAPVVAKPLSEVTAIRLTGLEQFTRAQQLLKAGKAAEAAGLLDDLVARTGRGWKNRLIRYWRLVALGRSGQTGRWVREWLRMVDSSSRKALVLGFRPGRLGPRGAGGNRRAISLLEARLKSARGDGARTAMKLLLLDLYHREGRKEAASLAKELLGGAGPSRLGKGAKAGPVSARDAERQFKSAAVLLGSDPARALAVIEKNLDRYGPAELATALLLSGKAQMALAAKAPGKQRRRLLLKAGLNFMRVWSYYPGGVGAAEALYLAGTVNASLSPPNLEAARAAWKRLISLYPTSPFADKARAAIGKLKR